MISVVIATQNSEKTLARAFESLIPAAVDSLVREVIVTDAGSIDGTHRLADMVGARVVDAKGGWGAQLQAGAAAARHDWLLFLHPNTALEPGWEDEAEGFMARVEDTSPRAGVFPLRVEGFTGAGKRFDLWTESQTRLFGRFRAEHALLIPRGLYHQVGGYRAAHGRAHEDLLRRLKRRITILRHRALLRAHT